MKNTMTKGEIRHELAKAKKELKDAWICGEGYEYDQNFIVCYKDGTVLETREANERLPQTGIIGIQFFGTDAHYTVGYEMYNGEKVLIEDESEDACYRVEYLPLTSTEATTENQTEVITMMYITSKVTGEKKATITMATEKRLQELMNREHQSNEAKFLVWALEEYKCECGCGGASIKEIRKYVEQEDWLRDEFGFDTEGYMEDTARAMNNRFHDYMTYWCRLCYSSLSIKSFNKLVKAVYDMTDEYGYVIYPEEVEEEPEATTETVESVEETTVSETETVETEVAEKVIMRLSDGDGNVLGVKIFVGTYKQADEEAERIMAETGCYVSYVRYTDSRWNYMSKEYYCGTDSESALTIVSPITMKIEQTAEQETELNTEVTQVEAEQTAENKTETTAENITVSGTNQDNINVLIVADVINTFEMITHTGYFDTS